MVTEPMKTLLILRHAKSSWKDDALPDRERPLNKRGREEAPKMGALLRKHQLEPDLVLSSPAQRARSTAELVIDESGYEGEVEYREELYSFDAEPYTEALAGLADSIRCVMLVGHNPAMEQLVEQLTGETLPMPTAALAQIELPIQHWSELGSPRKGKLVELWRPKEVKV
jgi:phosphohistidine phosphatase